MISRAKGAFSVSVLVSVRSAIRDISVRSPASADLANPLLVLAFAVRCFSTLQASTVLYVLCVCQFRHPGVSRL
jgi:hypothetical protein